MSEHVSGNRIFVQYDDGESLTFSSHTVDMAVELAYDHAECNGKKVLSIRIIYLQE
jgi:hypothetical protein